MKPKSFLLPIIIVIALFVSTSWAKYEQKQSPARTAWEYKYVFNISEEEINSLGSNGWEMAGFSVDTAGNKFMYFKRAR